MRLSGVSCRCMPLLRGVQLWPLQACPWPARFVAAYYTPFRYRASASVSSGRAELSTDSQHTTADSDAPWSPQRDSGSVTVLPSGVVTITTPPVAPAQRAVGVLQRVPVVSPGKEHLASAVKRAARLSYSTGIRNEAEKERNRAARQMDLLMKELSVPLTRYLTSYPDPDKLHPFELNLLQLTVGVPLYRGILAKVKGLRKAVQEMGKAYASRASHAPNKSSAVEAAAEGFQSISALFQTGIRHVDELKVIGQKLRALPHVDTGLPTLALVGAPNVGKSSLVKVLSSGTPEVCNYPFTTRSIQMGHFYLDGRKHQVTDTPGLLNRPDGDRNKMEMLTLAALDFLPTYIVFVMDLTEECGTSVADQWEIRQTLKQRYASRAWIDVVSKADMLEAVFGEADKRHAQLNNSAAGSLAVSAAQMVSGIISVSDSAHLHQPPASPFKGVDERSGIHKKPYSALDVAVMLEDALRVSSLTHKGIAEMQTHVISLLSKASVPIVP